jgi:hypothetical protein
LIDAVRKNDAESVDQLSRYLERELQVASFSPAKQRDRVLVVFAFLALAGVVFIFIDTMPFYSPRVNEPLAIVRLLAFSFAVGFPLFFAFPSLNFDRKKGESGRPNPERQSDG